MILEHYILIYSIIVNVSVIISSMIINKKDRICVPFIDKMNDITFSHKNVNRIHAKYTFFVNETDNVTTIIITDKISMNINLGERRYNFDKKNIHKYKNAQKLFNFLVNNLNSWNL